MEVIATLQPEVGIRRACRSVGMPRPTYYARRTHRTAIVPRDKPMVSPRALTPAERQQAFDVLTCEEFIDRSPASIVASLLDSNQYICSVRTFYRV